jgi:hypothetical protein
MVAAGLWKARPRKLGETHFWRARRSGYGEFAEELQGLSDHAKEEIHLARADAGCYCLNRPACRHFGQNT